MGLRFPRELHFLGLINLVIYAALSLLPIWQAHIPTVVLLFVALGISFIAALGILQRVDFQVATGPILFWAVCFRLLLLLNFAENQFPLSNDIYRYAWEGHLVRSGVSPYAYAPDDQSLGFLRQGVEHLWQRVDHRSIAAIYPPVAEYLFSLAAADTKGMQRIFFALDIILLLLLSRLLQLRKLARGQLLLYAWLPIACVEISYAAHYDVILLICILLGFHFSFRNIFASSLAFAFGCAAKYIAILPYSLLLFSRELSLKRIFGALLVWLLAIAALYLPFVVSRSELSGGLVPFLEHWRFNAFLYPLIQALFEALLAAGPGVSPRFGVLLLVLFGCFVCIRRRIDPFEGSLWLLWGLVLISPLIYPWYFLWSAVLVPLVPFGKRLLPLLVSYLTVPLCYEVLQHPEDWHVAFGLSVLEWGPVLAACVVWLPTLRRGKNVSQYGQNSDLSN